MVILPHCSSFEIFLLHVHHFKLPCCNVARFKSIAGVSYNFLFLIKCNIGNKFCICYHCSRDGSSQKYSSFLSELSIASEMMASRMKGEVVIGYAIPGHV
jgi:hypothetical protein